MEEIITDSIVVSLRHVYYIFVLPLRVTAIIEEPMPNTIDIYMCVKSSYFRLDAFVDQILLKSDEPLKQRRRQRTMRAGIDVYRYLFAFFCVCVCRLS